MKHKYRNEPTTIGEEKYRSKREARRHQQLLMLHPAPAPLDVVLVDGRETLALVGVERPQRLGRIEGAATIPMTGQPAVAQALVLAGDAGHQSSPPRNDSRLGVDFASRCSSVTIDSPQRW